MFELEVGAGSGGHPCSVGDLLISRGPHLCNVADDCKAERLTSFSELNISCRRTASRKFAGCSDQVN